MSKVPIVFSSWKYRRSKMIWMKTTIGIKTFWAKAARLISFQFIKCILNGQIRRGDSMNFTFQWLNYGQETPIKINEFPLLIANFLKKICWLIYLRKCLKITNGYNWLVRFINPIGNAFASLWSISPFLTDKNWNTIYWSQFKGIIRHWTIVIL